MEDYILAGCDVHEKSLEVKTSKNAEEPERRKFGGSDKGRKDLFAYLKRRAKAEGVKKIVLAYEAGPFGYGLHDDATLSGIECYVLAPTGMKRSPKSVKNKTDKKDAQRILEALRGHLLAGNDLPDIWVPDKATRDDREIVRLRLDLGGQCGGIRSQIGSLLKRHEVRKPRGIGKNWTEGHRRWLEDLTGSSSLLGEGSRKGLESLLRQLSFYESELAAVDAEVLRLSESERYGEYVEELCDLKGVGVLTAMVFLTEMGDMSRFNNRREVGQYMGLAPSSHETGEDTDSKGHITHQGPSRLRHVLCQATWCRVRCDAKEKAWYDQAVARNPKHKKIAVVGSMRRLGIVMWHRALEVYHRRKEAEESLSGPSGPRLRDWDGSMDSPQEDVA